MNKKVDIELWNSFVGMLNKQDTLKNFINYYASIVFWIESNKSHFTEDVLKRSRLDVLIKLEPTDYIIEEPDIALDLELQRLGQSKPKTIDNFAMIIGDTLWDMVTIRSEKDCPNCKGDELRYLLTESPLTNEQKIILECESCAWTENADGTKCNEVLAYVLPARKQDLIKFGICK